MATQDQVSVESIERVNRALDRLESSIMDSAAFFRTSATDIKLKAEQQRIAKKSTVIMEAYNRAQAEATANNISTRRSLLALSRQAAFASDIFNRATQDFHSSATMQSILVKKTNEAISETSGLLKQVSVQNMEDMNALSVISESFGSALHNAITTQEQFDRQFNELMDIQKNLHDEGIDTYSEFFEQLNTQITTATTLDEKLNILKQHGGELADVLKKAAVELEKPLTKFIDSLKQGAATTIETFFSFKAAMGTASFAAQKFYSDIQAMGKVGTVGSLTDLYVGAAKMGVSPEDLIDAQAANRQLIMNMGSAAKWSGEVNTLQSRYANYLGDNVTALKLTTEQLDSFARSGISAAASINMVGATSSTFEYLNKTMGVTSEQFMSLQHGLLETDEIRWSLMGASDAERKAIIQGTLARSKEWAQLGMTTEQMVKAEQALRGLAGMDPKQRFKKAAQLQMMAGIYGVGGGAELAEITRKGHRATPEELARSREIVEQINTQMAAGARGTYGQEFLSSRLQELAGMPQLLGPGSAITTELNTGVKFQESTAKDMKRAAEGLTSMADNVQQILTAVRTNTFILGVIAAAQTAGALINASGKIGGWLAGAGTAATAATTATTGTVAGGAAAGGLGVLAANTALVGTAGVVGYGTGMLLDKAVEQAVGEKLSSILGTADIFQTSSADRTEQYKNSPEGRKHIEQLRARLHKDNQPGGQIQLPKQPGVKTDATDISTNLRQTADHFNILAGKTDETNQLLKTIVEVGREQTNVLKTNKDDNIRLFDRGMRMGKMDTGSSNNALQLQAAKG